MTSVRAALRAALVVAAAVWRPALAQEPPDSITPALVALGDSVFHGRVGRGTCFACHGAKGAGGLAPLTSGRWLHSDGSYESIVRVVREGVPKPKQAPTPMPPMGGANLTPEQLRAVAAYVYTLGQQGGRAGP
jgi:mono/diheme cytochrome c family protein